MAITTAGLLLLGTALPASADDRAKIDADTQRALSWLRSSDGDTAKLLERAAGMLVFPDVVEMGFGVGGEFGEGSLLVDGQTVAYYATAGSHYGLQAEAGFKAEVILFMTEEALRGFREHRSWKVGEQIQVPVLSSDVYARGKQEPQVGLIFSNSGLSSELVLDGDRITRIAR